jgi:RNA polymerase sigma-70 factor, ECF subfamily
MGQAEQERFEVLYQRHARALMAYVLTRTTRQAAPDVVSSTFLVAWRRFGEVPTDALPWLIGVSRRVLADQLRAASRRRALDERMASDPTACAPPSADLGERLLLRGAIREAFVQLRPEDREILTLAAWQGQSTEQLATSLGCSKALASVRLHRARRRFGKFFEAGRSEPAPVGDAVLQPREVR